MLCKRQKTIKMSILGKMRLSGKDEHRVIKRGWNVMFMNFVFSSALHHTFSSVHSSDDFDSIISSYETTELLTLYRAYFTLLAFQIDFMFWALNYTYKAQDFHNTEHESVAILYKTCFFFFFCRWPVCQNIKQTEVRSLLKTKNNITFL